MRIPKVVGIVSVLGLCIMGFRSVQEKQSQDEKKEVKTEIISKGEANRYHLEPYRRIRDSKAWEKFWKMHQDKPGEIPKIDFEKRMIVAIFLGHSTQMVYDLGVTQTRESQDHIEITYRMTRVQKLGQSDTTSFIVVNLPISLKKVEVRQEGGLGVVHEFPAIKEGGKETTKEEARKSALEHIKKLVSKHIEGQEPRTWKVVRSESEDQEWAVYLEDDGDIRTVGKSFVVIYVDKKTGETRLASSGAIEE